MQYCKISKYANVSNSATKGQCKAMSLYLTLLPYHKTSGAGDPETSTLKMASPPSGAFTLWSFFTNSGACPAEEFGKNIMLNKHTDT